MEKTNLGVIILLGISIIGLIVLTALGITSDVLVPVITTLLGFLAGTNKAAIVGAFSPKKKKK